MPMLSNTQCLLCPKGRGSETGSSECRVCPQNSTFQSKLNCQPCDPGFYLGKDGCIGCKVGKYMDTFGLTSNCKNCPSGYISSTSKSRSCEKCQSNISISTTKCVDCVAGEFLEGNKCNICAAGQYSEAGAQSCKKCPANTSISDEGTDANLHKACQKCVEGQFSNEGDKICRACNVGMRYWVSSDGAQGCKVCPEGQYRNVEMVRFKPLSKTCRFCEDQLMWPNFQKTECTKQFISASECRFDEYLNTTDTTRANHHCVECPRGASCVGPLNWTGVRPLFGWARCLHDRYRFERCPFPAACLGGINIEFKSKYKGNISRIDHAERCNDAYVQGSQLCGQCATGFSRSGLDPKCDICPDDGSNVALAITGVVAGIFGLVIYIRITVSDSGSSHISDSVQSIGLSFVHLISLLNTFAIPWPDVFVSIFRVGGAVTVLGQSFVNLKCFLPKSSEADILYLFLITWALVPLILVISCIGLWLLIDKWKPVGSLRNTKIRTSCVAILYLIWPSLCTQTFTVFACKSICGENDNSYVV